MDMQLAIPLLTALRNRLGFSGKRDLSKFARRLDVHTTTLTGWLEGRGDAVVFCAKLAELIDRLPHEVQAYLNGELTLDSLLPPGPIFSRSLAEAIRSACKLTTEEGLVLLSHLATHMQEISGVVVPGKETTEPEPAAASEPTPSPARPTSLPDLVRQYWDVLVRTRISRERLNELLEGAIATPTEVVRLAQATGIEPDVIIDLNQTPKKNGQPNGSAHP